MSEDMKCKDIKNMVDISGMGNGYEATCQTMLQRGYEWLCRRQDNNKLKGHSYKGIYGIFEPDSESAKELSDVITKDTDCTGAMHQAVMQHLFYISEHGVMKWKIDIEKGRNYSKTMSKKHKDEKKEIVFIGNEFYYESGTMMSCVYEKTNDKYKRTDWGFIQIALEEGYDINMRPATEEEMKMFKEKLCKFKKKTNKKE